MEVIKKILNSKAFLFFLLLAVIWVGLVSIKAYYRKHQLDQEIASLKEQIGKLGKQDQDLSQLIKYFNNQNYLEKEAKEELNLKAEGENVVMVPEAAIGQELALQQTTSSAEQLPAPQPPAEENNLIKWWKYLFGR